MKSLALSTTAFFRDFAKGSFLLKLSYFIMGTKQFASKQYARGILFFLLQIGFILFMVFLGTDLLRNFRTLGVNPPGIQIPVYVPEWGTYRYDDVPHDNALLMLLYGVFTMFVIGAFFFIYLQSVTLSRRTEEGQKKDDYKKEYFKDDLKSLLNKNFHFSMMVLPLTFLAVFVVIPLVFMIFVGFTDYSLRLNLSGTPLHFFNWAGFRNWIDLFGRGENGFGRTFLGVFAWTMSWAVIATFSNYFLGIFIAMIINQKRLRFKKFFRLMLVLSIAVPQFVTLLILRIFLDDNGTLNLMLYRAGWLETPIRFLSSTWGARVTVIVANLWIGIPFTMLITTGILLNIPEELYESARIDGAGPATLFFKITMPFVLFVTTPYLITQFIGNINNFNVIFLLTGGRPVELGSDASSTDLLITWLYRLTIGENARDFSLASVIGIIIFVISAVFSLIFYRFSSTYKKEGEFA